MEIRHALPNVTLLYDEKYAYEFFIDHLCDFDTRALHVYKELYRLFRITAQRNIVRFRYGPWSICLDQPTLSQCAEIIARIAAVGPTNDIPLVYAITEPRKTSGMVALTMELLEPGLTGSHKRTAYIETTVPFGDLVQELTYILRLHNGENTPATSELCSCDYYHRGTPCPTVDMEARRIASSIFRDGSTGWTHWTCARSLIKSIPPSQLANDGVCCIL